MAHKKGIEVVYQELYVNITIQRLVVSLYSSVAMFTEQKGKSQRVGEG